MMPTLRKRLADTLSARLAAALDAHIAVLDPHTIVLASSMAGISGFPFDATPLKTAKNAIRVPLRVDNQPWEVIILRAPTADGLAQTLAEEVVALMADRLQSREMLPVPEELRDQFIHDLLYSGGGKSEEMLRAGQILGIHLVECYAVILIDATGYLVPGAEGPGLGSKRWRERVDGAIAAATGFFPPTRGLVAGYLGGGLIAVLLPGGSAARTPGHGEGGGSGPPLWQDLRPLKKQVENLGAHMTYETQSRVRLAMGRYHVGMEGLEASFREAQAALDLGRRLSDRGTVFCLDDLGVAAFLGGADDASKRDLAGQLLHGLDSDPTLTETVEAFFAEDCSFGATALRLAVHRNTLSYRFGKVAALTGLDPRRFEDAVLLRVALLVHALNQETATGPAGPRTAAVNVAEAVAVH